MVETGLEQLVVTYQTDETKRAECGDRIVELLGSRVEHVVRKYLFMQNDVDDIVQEVWIRIFRGLPGVREAASFENWCVRIAYNACTDQIRRRYKNLESPTDPETLESCPIPVNQTESVTDLYGSVPAEVLLSKSSAMCQKLLRMYFFDELVYREIGESLCKTHEAIRVAISRCLEAARKIFTKSSHTYV